jgi:hypothetical protein
MFDDSFWAFLSLAASISPQSFVFGETHTRRKGEKRDIKLRKQKRRRRRTDMEEPA